MCFRLHVWMVFMLAPLIGAGMAGAETIKVTINKMAFEPASIQAKVGDEIEWINKDAFTHTATVKGGWEVMLPVKGAGKVTVETPGALDYFCRFHPNMRGRITVASP